MMRPPVGSVWLPGSGIQIPPRLSIFGTVFVSTTLIHGVHFIDPKYSAACLISSGVRAFGDRDHEERVGLPRIRALA